jgi:FkbM family methyltransferase
MLPRVNLARFDDADYLLFSTPDLITNTLLQTGTWEPNLVAITSMFCGGVDAPLVLDIGANLGAYTIPVAKALQKMSGTVVAFEPQRIVYYQLCGNICLNRIDNVFALNQAVGETEAMVEIPRIDYKNFTNIGAFSIERKYRELNGSEASMLSGGEPIRVITLDKLSLPERPAFIKLDVEGSELRVLKGGMNFLRKNLYPPVLFEAWHESWFIEEKAALLTMFRELGYGVTPIGGYDHLAQHPKHPAEVRFNKQEDGTTTVERSR